MNIFYLIKQVDKRYQTIMYQVFVKTLRGNLVTIDVDDTTTIGTVKQEALKKQPYQVCQEYVKLRPLHQHSNLEEKNSLTACGVEKEQTLQMHWRGPVT